MLRTAEEIFKTEYDKADFITHKELAIICINEGIKDALEEAAKIASFNPTTSEWSIRELIKEIK